MSRQSFPEVYTTPPPQPDRVKPGQLNHDQVQFFFNEGYLFLPTLFSSEELDDCLEGLEEYVDAVAKKLIQEGKINDLCKDFDLWHRLVEMRKAFPDVSIAMSKHGKFPKNLERIWGHEKLVDIIEQLVGPNVGGTPTWNIRFNTPDMNDGACSYVPWHQDSAYITDENSRGHLIITVWIPFQDTGSENGGMVLLPRSHRKGYCATHEASYQSCPLLYSREEVFEKELIVSAKDEIVFKVPKGGALIFSNMLMHRSLPNKSDKVRWSADLRYQSTDSNWGYYGITDGIKFRENGKPVTPNFDDLFHGPNRLDMWLGKYFSKEAVNYMAKNDIIVGPWMGKWEHTTPNKHSKAYKELYGKK